MFAYKLWRKQTAREHQTKMAKQPRRYFQPDDHEGENSLTPSRLKRLRKSAQVAVMVAWFNGRYEDPAHETPYESAEGGYQYIWGGPYDAKEELFDEFGDLIDEAVIDEAVAKVESDGTIEWAPGSNHPNMRDREEEALAEEREEVLYTPEAEPAANLQWVLDQLANGAEITLGTREEAVARSAALEQLDRLQSAFKSRPPTPGIGHNNPPPDAEDEVCQQVLNDSITIQAELKQAAPDVTVVAEATSRLKTAWKWFLKKADAAADEFAKTAGKAAAIAAGAIGAAQLPVLHDAVAKLGNWLTTVIFPF